MGSQKLRLNFDYDPKDRLGKFTGDTFEAKEILKSNFGARWTGSAWTISVGTKSGAELYTQLCQLFPEWELNISGLSQGDTDVNLTPPTTVTARKEMAKSLEPEARPGALSVLELIGTAEQAIKIAFPQRVLVYGVISTMKADLARDRMFIDLSPKDDPSISISCVIWNGVAKILAPIEKLGFKLEKDLDVMFEVTVGVNRRKGALSLTIVRIDETYMIGKLAALREATNLKLKAEGLFDKNKLLPFPIIPRKLLLLTSAAGTVIHDFLSSLAIANFGFELLVQHVTVQGTTAKAEIIKALQSAEQIPDLDAILIFRGGGSVAELSVFSEYEVARTVCLATLPILSAIGHEQDQSSTQDVSHRAFGVPKDLGRFLADIILDLRRNLQESQERIQSHTETFVERLENKLHVCAYTLQTHSREVLIRSEHALESHLRSIPAYSLSLCEQRSLSVTALEAAVETNVLHTLFRAEATFSEKIQSLLQGAERAISEIWTRLNHVGERIAARAEQRISPYSDKLSEFSRQFSQATSFVEARERDVELLEALVRGSSPEVQLRRGFSIVRLAANQQIVSSVHALSDQSEIEVQLSDGSVKAVTKG